MICSPHSCFDHVIYQIRAIHFQIYKPLLALYEQTNLILTWFPSISGHLGNHRHWYVMTTMYNEESRRCCRFEITVADNAVLLTGQWHQLLNMQSLRELLSSFYMLHSLQSELLLVNPYTHHDSQTSLFIV
jgi:hypothetical protein